MHALPGTGRFQCRAASGRRGRRRTLAEVVPEQLSGEQQRGILAAAAALCWGSVTSVTENEYKRIVSLYFKWCSALGLAREFTFEGLASWAWFYAQHFTQRSLAGHWSAMRLWCVANGRDFPADDSICWRRMTRVTKALRLRDPTTAIRAYPLETVWLRRMLAIDGIHTLSDMWSPELSLFRVVFWARVCTAHSAMLRACEHEQGLLNSHLTLLPAPDASARSAFSGSYFELAVGELPPGMKPIFASNRKLRLRAARDCVLLAGV